MSKGLFGWLGRGARYSHSQDVTFVSPDGVTVPGTLCIAEKSRATAILLHGITTDRNEYLDFYRSLSEHLTSYNVSTLRFDFRGHGASKEAQTAFSPVGQLLDLLGAVDFLKQKFGSAGAPQVAFGTSFGAAPAIFVSKILPTVFKKLYLLAPVLDYQMTFLNPRTNWAKEFFTPGAIADAYVRGYLVLDEFKVGVRALVEMGLLNPTETASQLEHMPIRIIHGRADSMVPIEQSRVMHSLGKHVSLIEIENMDHGYNAVGDDGGTSAQSLKNRQDIFDDFVRFLGDGNGSD